MTATFKKKYSAWYLFIGLLLLNLLPVKLMAADNNWLQLLTTKVKAFFQHQNQDKIFLHTDRTFYAVGDTVWYKAYLVDANSLAPRIEKEIVHVLVYDLARKVVSRNKHQVSGGMGAAQLVLPDSLGTGNYTLVAYTNWMRNAGPEHFFRKTLVVIRPEKTTAKVSNASVQKLAEIQFFPEGGFLVAGLESKIGFKAITQSGQGMPVEGKITDQTGKVVATFKTGHAGIGSFSFKPESNTAYRAQVILPNAETRSFTLPVAKPAGITLQANNLTDTSLLIKISGTPEQANVSYTLLIQGRGRIYLTNEVTLDKNAIAMHELSKKQFQDGIVQVNLFGADRKLAAERLVFVNKQQQLKLKITTNKEVYSRKENVTVNLEAKDNAGLPVSTEFSFAVSDLNQNSFLASNPSVFSNLLLSADLEKRIEDPDFYFRNNEPATKKALDDLLLTQRLSRFNWDNVQHSDLLAMQYPREQELELKGSVYDKNGQPLNKAIIFLLELGTGKSELVTANENGFFNLKLKEGTNNQRYFFQVWQQGTFQKQARLDFVVNTVLLPQDSALVSDNTLAGNKLMLQAGIRKQYALPANKASEADTSRLLWLNKPADKTYQLSNYSGFQDVEEVFKEIVPGIRIRSKNNETESRVINTATKKFYNAQPLYLIDGQPTFNDDLVLRMNADLVQEVSVFYSSASLQQFGFIGNQGVVAIRTKSGNFKAAELETNNIFTVPGSAKEFPFKVANATANEPDLRPTLYWNPHVKTDSNGRATITFPSSDAASHFRIEVKGISDAGLIGEAEMDFKSIVTQ